MNSGAGPQAFHTRKRRRPERRFSHIFTKNKINPERAARQGREDAGHPLLRRALAIQTRALGADHPDVVAIREVLEQED